MEFLFDIFSSAGFGSIIGLVGGAFSKWMEHKAITARNQHELDMMNARTDLMIKTAKVEQETANVVGKLAVDKIEAKAFEHSQKSSEIGNTVKAFVRPIILAVLAYFTYDIYTQVDSMVDGLNSLPEKSIVNLYKMIVLSIIALFSLGTSWYFAQRNSKQFDVMMSKWVK